MPPPDDKEASAMAQLMFECQQRRLANRATMDSYPASHSDLIWCALELKKAGYVQQQAERGGSTLSNLRGSLVAEQPAMCGNCGGEHFTVKLTGSPDVYRAIELTCVKCASTSVLRVTEPKIRVEWGDGAQGVVCPKGG